MAPYQYLCSMNILVQEAFKDEFAYQVWGNKTEPSNRVQYKDEEEDDEEEEDEEDDEEEEDEKEDDEEEEDEHGNECRSKNS